MINILFAECGLELIPKELWNNPIIRKYCRKRGRHPSKVLLDISFHYKAMLKLKDWFKRGRPDIIHICLLEALGSPLNINGLLRIFVHTVDGKIIFIDPETRIPRNYYRFTGLIAQLLEKGRVPPKGDKKLLWIEDIKLEKFLEKYKYIVLFDEEGKYRNIFEFIDKISIGEDILLIIGGFQRGKFNKIFYEKASEIISIYEISLDSWIIASRIICAFERKLKVI